MDVARARAQFPVLESFAYLNAGSFGPTARATLEMMEERLERDLELGRSRPDLIREMTRLRHRVRERIARLLGVETDQIALTCSTTDGCNIVLAGLDLSADDEIVTTTHEHFGLLGPLHVSGARIVVAEPETERILAAITPKTRLLALSEVLWTDGRVLPVAELRERSGLPVLVDGAQAAGAIPVDASGVDFFTVSAQKWLCGPDTVGALYVRDPGSLRVAQPSYFSQKSFEPTGEFVPRAGAERFDSQWISSASLAGLLAALDSRPEWAFGRAAEMTELCRSKLAEHYDVVSLPGQGTLVSWRMDGDLRAIVRRLFAEGVVVRDIPGFEVIRASCGWWTSEDDVERLLGALGA
jgi:L-cysteine/cystine lyase